jgi:hypothetical protein
MAITVFDPKFKRLFRKYLLQVSLATAALSGVLAAEQLLSGPVAARAALMAAIASTAFVLFISPHSRAAHARNVLGVMAWRS